MNVLDLLSSEIICSRIFRSIRWSSGVYCPRCNSRNIKSHEKYKHGLKRYFCKSCKRTFNDKTGTIFHYSRLSLREWFILILLFLGLHNSSLGLSWLLDRSPITIFKALKKLMLKLRTRGVELKGAIEVDELYINAGLKGKNNSIRIKHLDRKPRHRAFRKRGRGSWEYDKPAIFILVSREGGEDYVPSSNVEAETAIKIIDRHILKNSIIYTDNFKSYLGLNELGYKHEYVNHSEKEWVKGECHINNCENRASILRPWLSIHRGICKDNLKLYLEAFKICRKSRTINPIKAIIEIIKMICIITATTFLVKSERK